VRGSVGVAAVGLLGVAVGVWAQPGENRLSVYQAPAAAVVPAGLAVERLVGELDDRSAARRASAAEGLLRMGDGIEPQLRWELQRLKAAIPASALEGQTVFRPYAGERAGTAVVLPRYAEHELAVLMDRMEDARRLHPPRVTLHFKNARLTEVLAELGRQLGQNVSILLGWTPNPMNPQDVRLSVDVDGVTFWAAVAAILHVKPEEVLQQKGDERLDVGEVRVPLPASLVGSNTAAAVKALPGESGPLWVQAAIVPKWMDRWSGVAAAVPALTGAVEIGEVEVDAATGESGRSLMGKEKPVFLSPLEHYGFGWASESHSQPLMWWIPMPLEGVAAEDVRGVRGRFGVALAPERDGLALNGLETLLQEQPVGEREVDIDPDCLVLVAPGAEGEPYRKERDVCRASEWKESHIAATATDPQAYHVYERTYTLHNVEAVPVRFVVSFGVYDQWWIDSDPQPAVVAPGAFYRDTRKAIFVVQALPGEVVHLHVGERGKSPLPLEGWDKGFPALPAQTFPAGPGKALHFDGITVTVKAMERTLAGYVVRGEMSGPAGAPAFATPLHRWAVNWDWDGDFLRLRLLDAERWHMESHVEYGEVRHEGARDVVEWRLSTNEPGRVPATLLWYTPRATRWLEVPFGVEVGSR
jgi:hypothetical protein